MRIISKFKDYYDIGMAYGQDQSLVFYRLHSSSITPDSRYGLKPTLFQKDCSNERHSLGISYQRIVVGFCGKIHLCYRLNYSSVYTPLKTAFVYDAEGVREFAEKHMTRKNYESFMQPANKHSWRTSFKFVYVEKRFNEFDKFRTLDYFLDSKTVLFIAKRHRTGKSVEIDKNACLKDVEFYKVVDSYTGFQDISMFLGGVLGVGEPDIIEISDECKRDGKGFNNQSFKTRPGTKPTRKRKK